MAAAHVLHVGIDCLHRAQVLRSAGYAVDECETLAKMAAWLRQGHMTDLVCISEERDHPAEGAIALARSYTVAPVVLFCDPSHNYSQKGWDLELRPLTPPDVWLSDLQQLLASSRVNRAVSEALRDQTQRLRIEVSQLNRQSRELRERITQQIKRNRPGR